VVITFAFLAVSAIASYLAILYIPSALSAVIRNREFTIQRTSFSVTPPIGDTPSERIMNQLSRTNSYVKMVVRRNPGSARLDAHVKGKSGKDHVFDVYVHNVNSFGRLVGNRTDMNIFVRRFDEVNPISLEYVRTLKEEVKDSFSGVGRKFPTRVMLVPTSGFDDDVFEYIRSKEGSFRLTYPRMIRRIELVQERIDGSFDVLSF
jgi:hypothetical protein